MRLPPQVGERIDRSERRSFTFRERTIEGYAGDTIGSALYAAGVRVFGRSFKYHRPRGLTCCSGSCAGCLMEVDGVPNVRVCARPLEGGEAVSEQVVWGTLERDPLRVVDRLGGPLTPVGFYYRTMIRPRRAWPYLERALRSVSAAARAPAGRDRGPRFDREHRNVDVLVVGAGRSGRRAALRAASSGRSVLLVDERPENAALRLDGVEVLAPARALGVYEGRLVAVESANLALRVRAKQVIVAAGAIEQPLLFPGNDLVGVMTPAGAMRLVTLWSLRPGERAVVLAADKRALEAAERMRAAGVEIAEVVELGGRAPSRIEARKRWGRLAGVRIDDRVVACDLLIASAGRQPAYSLLAQAGARVGFEPQHGIFVPTDLPEGVEAVGAVTGAGCGVPVGSPPAKATRGRCFVCTCEDVTVSDLVRAVREGFDSVEIAKRYTTITMGPCQGRLCQLNAVRLLARETGRAESEIGATTARPPWSPTPLGLLAGRPHVPGKRTPIHERHNELGAAMVWTGDWRRPRDYGDPAAEMRAVHRAAGVIDVSTLGKLLVSGPDALRLLDGVYPNRLETLDVGRVRYTGLSTQSGRLADDGTITRLAEDRYFVTTTSGASDLVYETLEGSRQGRRLDAEVVNLSGAFAALAISGPQARIVMQRLTAADLSKDGLGYMGATQIELAGVQALMIRIGFMGELGFEAHFPSPYARYLWDTVLAHGANLGLRPVGVDALKALRLEKGHIIVGIDTDPESTLLDVGLERMIAWDKGEFNGRAALAQLRERGVARRLVGFRVASGWVPPEGAAVIANGGPAGRVTSSAFSEEAGGAIGLAYVPADSAEDGRTFLIDDDGQPTEATVHGEPFVDPEGTRLRR